MTDNPFFAPSALPYGLPDFENIREEHFLPAFERGMAEQIAEIDAIKNDPAPVTFENTLTALERSGAVLRRVSNVFFTFSSSDATDGVKEIEKEMSPRLAAHADAITLDRDLWKRIEKVMADGPEEAALLERYRTDFVKAGALLDEADQTRLRELNGELARLSTEFGQNVVESLTESALVVDDAAELDGLDEDRIAMAEQDGKYVLPLLNVSVQPALARLTDRSVRERLHTLSVERAPGNVEIAARMAALRAERAALLGYPDHAAYKVADQTAKTVEAVEERLGAMVEPAVRNLHRLAGELEELAGHPIQAWDWAFYAEKVRQSRYHVDEAALRPYFELERVFVDGVFHAATGLYGITFTERTDLRGYHPDVRVWEVFDADGSGLGLFLLDPYARPTKGGGAWMHNLVEQSELLGQRPVVVNNLNITKPVSGPTLLTPDELNAAFHEFGHALHGLLSSVRFPRLEGTEVPRDFVEFPSQVNEMWANDPEVLANYARHHETGEPVPTELIEKMVAAERYDQGFATVEYLAAALLDWSWHRIAPGEEVDPATFETEALKRWGLDLRQVRPRYRTAYFQHCFAGDYHAGYYSYVWSEVLDADSVEWFTENGGLTRENGDRFRRLVLSVGGSVDPMAATREFLGREPRLEPLLNRRGLI
ncbi:M3 family metallopeptidase [Nocardiopsis sp. N85]|uniref:M3 family metallopeptidase n=1 Tax=Nocardiopsis sp. N85 TaxID=3029400 RepID=UPI00237F6B7E|nr:M3 family metallopeptidase [Nocardiopsis sp. N85]MDE3723413.1 M3 family metallopeptidase [Nocardiopsis sp. N85]